MIPQSFFCSNIIEYLASAVSNNNSFNNCSLSPRGQDRVALENELERTAVQVSEASTVRRHYTGMRGALRGEAALHTTSLDALNTKHQEEKMSLKQLRVSQTKYSSSCG